MRDPNRIGPILKELAKVWQKNPDLRLGQLIGNVLEGPALYYTEDDKLINVLKKYYNVNDDEE